MGLAFFMKIFFNHNGRKVLKQRSQSIRYAGPILTVLLLCDSEKPSRPLLTTEDAKF
jgi:hypothetical protein